MNTLKHLAAAKEAYDFVCDLGYTPWVVLLYGSQNYDLDTPNSDYDWKVIVLPTLDEVLDAKTPKSKVYNFGDGQVDVKDVRVMFHNYEKQNPNFMETLFTPYYCVNPVYVGDWTRVRALANRVAYADPVKAMNAFVGMAMEKQHALCHPYESKLEILKEHGYDAKQLCHEYRLSQMLTKFVTRDAYGSLLVPNPEERKFLMDVKTYHIKLSVEEAQNQAAQVVRAMQERREDAMNRYRYGVDTAAYEALHAVKRDVLKRHFKEQL